MIEVALAVSTMSLVVSLFALWRAMQPTKAQDSLDALYRNFLSMDTKIHELANGKPTNEHDVMIAAMKYGYDYNSGVPTPKRKPRTK